MHNTSTVTGYIFPYQAASDTYGLLLDGEAFLILTHHDQVSYAEMVRRVERDIRKRSPSSSIRLMVGGKSQRETLDRVFNTKGAMPLFGVYM